MANVSTCGELLQKKWACQTHMTSEVRCFSLANLVKVDECGGTNIGIDLNSKTRKSPELMSPSLGRILKNAHSSSYMSMK